MMIGTSDHGGFFRQQQRAGAFLQSGANLVDGFERLAREARCFEVRAHELRIAPDRGDDQYAVAPIDVGHVSRISFTMLSNVGVPVRTPR
jgi:hypothetical protein